MINKSDLNQFKTNKKPESLNLYYAKQNWKKSCEITKFCNRWRGLSAAIQLGTPEPRFFPFWSKTDMDSVQKNFYLAPDLKKIKPKKVANDQKINLAP